MDDNVQAFCSIATREEYIAYLAEEADRDIAYAPKPIGRYKLALCPHELLLSERDEPLHLDLVVWNMLPDGGISHQ